MAAPSDADVQDVILKECMAGKDEAGRPMPELKAACETKFGVAAFRKAMRALMSADKIQAKNKEGVVYVKAKAGLKGITQVDEKVRTLPELERRVFAQVKESGGRGTWMKEIKAVMKTFATDKQVEAALKHLEKRECITTFKSRDHRTKRVYIVVGVDPDESVTGGTFYDQAAGQFDREFVEVLYRTIFQTVKATHQATVPFIERRLGDAQVLKNKNVKDTDIQAVIDILVFDGRLAKVHGSTGINTYCVAKTLVDWNSFTETPCMNCSQLATCDVASVEQFNPKTCPYLTAWVLDEPNDVVRFHDSAAAAQGAAAKKN
eukprot:TRINITY_DN21255_c0_g1_i1.p1 TRINITY_DN21255_c0_g1~~TRINITY_DN21255_c0_g1_i1.p1  ORF type:complete len:319 (+),score=93.76 TRINITY_DN21255_c0_g1_i1:90-1046(+)